VRLGSGYNYPVILTNSTRPTLPVRLQECNTFWLKLRGLMGRPSLAADEGIALFIQPPGRINASIHMFFMRFDIAVIWLDTDNRVIHKEIARRWRPYYAPPAPARLVLELHPSRINDYNLGDQVTLTHA